MLVKVTEIYWNYYCVINDNFRDLFSSLFDDPELPLISDKTQVKKSLLRETLKVR